MSSDAGDKKQSASRARSPHRKRTTDRGQAAALAKSERLVAIAATVTILGLGIAGVGDLLLGGFATLAGLAGLMYAIHKYGRLGEEH